MNDLKDAKTCLICMEPFLSNDAEIPIKLPCKHVFGTACMLHWLSPLSGDGKNSCPFCRKQILDHAEIKRVKTCHKLLTRLGDGLIDDNRDSPPAQAMALEKEKAQILWVEFCEGFVSKLEMSATFASPEKCIDIRYPMTVSLINLMTLQQFAEDDKEWKIRFMPDSYLFPREVSHRFLSLLSRNRHKAFNAPEDQEAACLRAAGYHSRIKASKAKMCARLQKGLEIMTRRAGTQSQSVMQELS